MTKCIALHSYKGGTGKSTISSNLSATLARKGLTAVLLDLDVYAPSLQDYFQWQPHKSINDYLFENATVDEVIHDLSAVLKKFPSKNGEQCDSKGKLLVAFSSTSKDEIYKLDGAVRQEGSKIQLLRKFLMLREEIVSKYNADFIIIDTSPGIRYWSINSLAIADTILLSLKLDGIDLKGTRLLAKEIYDSLTKLGTKSYLLLNRAAGYCLPPNLSGENNSSNQELYKTTVDNQTTVISKLSADVGMDTILSIPCYCDIQFDSNEFLTALRYPDHPFAGKIESLIEQLKKI
ncbi:MAG: AAA family ATPase [Nitrososphaeraceae archaeon]|nr:AAA family ATPase [Nitrososphaeraceae archaeon]MDW0168827.1 AAA family ATPase [Nitrososphaeraceae archaeon]MDW0176151.1 AAA family ATPase [Nitrososphaeraceae archaeon]MDW0181100.1 AAA family ATPase [Nitrososphaeraceae archaeon]MDW0185288.1 AAA family ATPase [Nitrososphaeraceae archaeon]